MTDHQAKARELLRKHTDPEIGVTEAAALRAITAALRLAVPDGYVLVPREPTVNMVCRGIIAYDGTCESSYRAMLAAAPGRGRFRSCQCFTERDKQLCLHKHECSVVTASSGATP